jgi:hypothetical protein
MAYEVSARRTELSTPTEAQRNMRVARHCLQFCWSTRRNTPPLAKSAKVGHRFERDGSVVQQHIGRAALAFGRDLPWVPQ